MLPLGKEALDTLTQAATGWFEFEELIDVRDRWHGYIPVIDGQDPASFLLADLYDQAQAERGDPRRAARIREPRVKEAQCVEEDIHIPALILELQKRNPFMG